MIEEMRELYGGLDLNAPDMPTAGAADLAPPGGTFLVGYRDGLAVCGGGIKRLPDARVRSNACTWCRGRGDRAWQGRCWRRSRMPPAAWVIASRARTPGPANPTRAGPVSLRVTCQSEISTASRWPHSSVRSSC